VTTSAGAFEEFTTVDRRHGRHTWRWRISSSTLEPSVEADGSVALLTGGQRSGLVIAPATILDGHGQSVTPAGTSWSVRRAGKGWLLQLVLDDAALPVPYTIDPAVSVVTFAGTP
jgi:hypothetical protein